MCMQSIVFSTTHFLKHEIVTLAAFNRDKILKYASSGEKRPRRLCFDLFGVSNEIPHEDGVNW